jgi:hypothetical protein
VKIVLAYIAVTNGPLTEDYCARFAATHHEFPPGAEHDTLIICQGGPLPTSTTVLFSGMKASMWPHINDGGWDVSAYIDAARGPCAEYDMMLCCGESVYFHRAGWLKRFVEAWEKIGPGMHGPFSSNSVRAHLNTTAFCCHPLLLKQYPVKVSNRAERYAFEHGDQSLWRRIAHNGMPVRLVTWDGEYEPRAWRYPQNILWRGDQSNCLMWCNHSDGFRNVDHRTKASWARSTDQPFK